MTADELKEWMTANGYSVRGLARALDLSPTTVQAYRTRTTPVPRIIELAIEGLEARLA